MLLLAQHKQAEGQSEAARKRNLQKEIEQLKAQISQLDSQISGTEEQSAVQGQTITVHLSNFLHLLCTHF